MDAATHAVDARHAECCDRGDGLILWADIANGPRLPVGSYAQWQLAAARRADGSAGSAAQIRLNQGAGWSAASYDERHGALALRRPVRASATCGNGVFTPFDVAGINSRDVSLR